MDGGMLLKRSYIELKILLSPLFLSYVINSRLAAAERTAFATDVWVGR